MKFLHYHSLARCFDLSIEKLDDDALNQIKERAEDYFKSNDILKCGSQVLSMTDVFVLLDGLRNPAYVVFNDWIKNDTSISTLLQGEFEKLNLQATVSNKKYKGHALEKQFYSFLTPFLHELLAREVSSSIATRDFDRLRFYLQYSTFLEESKKFALQQEVDRELRKLFTDNKEVKLLTSLSLVDVLNMLDKQFYAIRVLYIDTVKTRMTQPDLDPATFNLLSRAIKNVALNNSHKSQVDAFLQKGKTSFYQKQKNTVFNKALFRNPLIYLGFLAIIILVLLIFPFEFTDNTPVVKQKISGLDSLSQDEVKKTDSLLAYKEDSALFETDDMTVPVALPDFILSDNTGEIKNTMALKLYESMLNDYEIQQNNASMSCDPMEAEKLEAFNYKGVDDISWDFSNHKIFNKSDQDCYLLYFQNKDAGAVYGKLLPAGSSIELKLVKNWCFVFYTGNEFTSFNPLKTTNKGYGNLDDAKKIDKSFTSHFCKMNYSNFRVLSKIYHVTSICKTTRLIKNSSGSLEIDSKCIRTSH